MGKISMGVVLTVLAWGAPGARAQVYLADDGSRAATVVSGGTGEAPQAAKPSRQKELDLKVDALSDKIAKLDALTDRVSKVENASNAWKVEIHGFTELDILHDDTHSFTEVIGDGAVKGAGTQSGNNGWTQSSIRASRLTFLAAAPELDGWKTKGCLEVDFLGYDPSPTYTSAASSITGAPTEAGFFTNPAVRIRQAYLGVEKDGWGILAGQAWSLYGWQADYLLASVSVAPYPGALFERTSQARFSKTLDFGGDLKLLVAVSAERPEQRDSQVPNLDGGLKLSFGGLKGRFALAPGAVNTVPLSLGLSGTLRDYVYYGAADLLDENQDLWGNGIALDALIPVLPFDGKDGPSLVLTGEWSAGSGDGDEFCYWTGGLKPLLNNANTVPNLDAGIAGYDGGSNLTLVQLSSWNAQAQFHFPKSWDSFLTLGYGELFSPNVGGLASTPGGAVSGIYNDDSVMFANLMHDFTANIRVAAEYARIDTHYANGGGDALDHRLQASAWYRF